MSLPCKLHVFSLSPLHRHFASWTRSSDRLPYQLHLSLSMCTLSGPLNQLRTASRHSGVILPRFHGSSDSSHWVQNSLHLVNIYKTSNKSTDVQSQNLRTQSMKFLGLDTSRMGRRVNTVLLRSSSWGYRNGPVANSACLHNSDHGSSDPSIHITSQASPKYL